MKAIDLQGKEFIWNLGKYVNKKSGNASALHVKTRDFLAETYPAIQILEEVVICDQMRLDFFIPILRVAIECQGEQHGRYTPHFHGVHKAAFYKSRSRDNNKARFCELNNITLVYFYAKETEEEWKKKLI